MNDQPALEIGFFWDYENVRIPSHVEAVEVAQRALRTVSDDAAQWLGFARHRIVERRLYYDSRKPSERKVDRSGLGSSFTLIDCPTRNQKETIDKRIIIDLMLFAYERVLKGAPVCIVLMSSDGDFAYIISVLRDLGAKVVIIFGSNVSTPYLESADYTLHWLTDVLHGRGSCATPAAAVGWEAPPTPLNFGWQTGETAASSQQTETQHGAAAAAAAADDDDDDSRSDASSSVELGHGDGAGGGGSLETLPDLSNLLLTLNSSLKRPGGIARATTDGSDAAYDGQHRELLLCVRKLQLRAMKDAPPGAQFEELWVSETALEEMYVERKLAVKSASLEDIDWNKRLFKNLSKSALEADFLEVSRSGLRSADATSRMVPQTEWASHRDGALSAMRYVRLTQAGARADAEDEEDPIDANTFQSEGKSTGGLVDGHLPAQGSTVEIGQAVLANSWYGLVGPEGAAQRCHNGPGCYHLKRDKCNYLHTEAEAQAIKAKREQGTVIAVGPIYGFIKPDIPGENENRWFNHALTIDGTMPALNCRVQFIPDAQKSGKPMATFVRVIDI